jgi:hypothetical protein
MGDVAQHLLESTGIDTLHWPAVLAREFFNLPYTRIVTPIRKPHRYNALRMPLERHAHRVHAINRLSALQAPSARHVFNQVQVHESFYRIDCRNNDPDVCTCAQPPPSVAAGPGMSVVLHDILVVAKIVEVQKPVNRDIQYLHEASELDDRRDDPVKCLTYAFTQVSALEK